MKQALLSILKSLLLGLGCISLISPAFFYWWIHGSYERYLWIINGPEPYSYFGGGPYQLWNFFVFPILIGILLITTSFLIKQK